MSITFVSEEIDFVLSNDLAYKNWLNNVIDNYKKELGELNYIFVSDEKILEINSEYLNHDYYTDIITFDHCVGDVVSGDMFISIDTVESNSIKFGTQFIDELNRVIVHGLLHLLGFNDKNKDEEAQMRKVEEDCMVLFQK